MNKLEATAIYAVREGLMGVPFPVQGKLHDIQYVADMREARPLIVRVIDAVLYRESPEVCEQEVSALRHWLARRAAEGWSPRIPSEREQGKEAGSG